ncbi:ComEC/Rec2 family competence protein [Pseudophaeobacter sp. EL27]|uniref:ComEC/Rec2 family competence protein n=1 Tax=Pseudophaeobacter sp. EL27 TaxID=2107580 RepID=UPI00352B0F72
METKNEPDFANEPEFAPVYRGREAGATIQILLRIDQALQAQRGHLMPWIPVALGFGIGWFFLLRKDPGVLTWSLLALAAIVALPFTQRGDARAFVAWAVILIGMGFAAAGVRCALVQAPVLSFRYYGPVEGRLIKVDRSSSGAVRLTLDQVRLARVAPEDRPARIRLSLTRMKEPPEVGAKVATTAHLMPPQGPSEPSGFDFRRYAWFQKIGANGYTRAPVVVLAPAQSGLYLPRFRSHLSQAVQQRLGPETGGFAAAIIAGDRAGVEPKDLQALRVSNLAHLLAISGLHMGLLTGFVFAVLRFSLCLIPKIALRWNVKKIAASTALVVGLLYLGISGGSVSTERAFIMVLVLFVAILLDRRALTLRAVAVAATLVLLRRPETLLSPGFQMSFAATTALVAVFGWIRIQQPELGPAWLRPLLTVLLSSVVAGAATAPFGAAHFHVLSHYGLLGNVLAVPVMGLVVVPAAVLSLCLAPFGIEQIGVFFLHIGLEWILMVAAWVAAFPNAQSGVVMPGPWVLPLFTFGALLILLWQGGFRWAGLLLMGASLMLWGQATRPLVLVAANGGLVGVITPEGRALSRANSQGYTARNWLAADGGGDTQAEAAQRWEAQVKKKVFLVAGRRIIHITGKRQAQELRTCQPTDLVISNTSMKAEGVLEPEGGCEVWGKERLRRSGSLMMGGDGQMVSAADLAGNRPWSRP